MLSHLFTTCQLNDVTSLAATCQRLTGVVHNDDSIWRAHICWRLHIPEDVSQASDCTRVSDENCSRDGTVRTISTAWKHTLMMFRTPPPSALLKQSKWVLMGGEDSELGNSLTARFVGKSLGGDRAVRANQPVAFEYHTAVRTRSGAARTTYAEVSDTYYFEVSISDAPLFEGAETSFPSDVRPLPTPCALAHSATAGCLPPGSEPAIDMTHVWNPLFASLPHPLATLAPAPTAAMCLRRPGHVKVFALWKAGRLGSALSWLSRRWFVLKPRPVFAPDQPDPHDSAASRATRSPTAFDHGLQASTPQLTRPSHVYRWAPLSRERIRSGPLWQAVRCRGCGRLRASHTHRNNLFHTEWKKSRPGLPSSTASDPGVLSPSATAIWSGGNRRWSAGRAGRACCHRRNSRCQRGAWCRG